MVEVRQTDEIVAFSRAGWVSAWAGFGLVFCLIAGQAWWRWLRSDLEFRAAPILAGDTISQGTLISLRVLEFLSILIFVWIITATIIVPLRRQGKLGFDGLTTIGCLIASITDGVLNLREYLFAWNAYSVNLGAWTAYLPFHKTEAPSHYAEALLWGLPMYLYFVMGAGIMGSTLVNWMRQRYPRVTDVSAFSIVFLFLCGFDIVVENAIIRTTEAYAFAKTPGSLTLWAGTLYQFPIYEMVLVGLLGTAFAMLRQSAVDSADKLSFIERGIERYPARWRGLIRALAVTGFCITTLLCVYHIPFSWFGFCGDTFAPLPSYLRPGP
jgi:Spirocyclase AveC-like